MSALASSNRSFGPSGEALIGLREVINARHYIWVGITAIVLSYGTYLVFDSDTVSALGEEDALFENLTAAGFLIASLYFLAAFLRSRNWFLLLLSLVFLIGCGEEISWGQRIFGFATPEPIAAINVQGEFNLHNIEIVNARDFSSVSKEGVAKLLTINFLYKLFWLTYGVLLPIAAHKIRPAASFLSRLHIPIPPLAIGILFLVNWLAFRLCLYLLPIGATNQFYDTVGEIMECISSLVFVMISIWFYRALTLPAGGSGDQGNHS